VHEGGEFTIAARDSALDGGESSDACGRAMIGNGVHGEAGPGVGIGGGI